MRIRIDAERGPEMWLGLTVFLRRGQNRSQNSNDGGMPRVVAQEFFEYFLRFTQIPGLKS